MACGGARQTRPKGPPLSGWGPPRRPWSQIRVPLGRALAPAGPGRGAGAAGAPRGAGGAERESGGPSKRARTALMLSRPISDREAFSRRRAEAVLARGADDLRGGPLHRAAPGDAVDGVRGEAVRDAVGEEGEDRSGGYRRGAPGLHHGVRVGVRDGGGGDQGGLAVPQGGAVAVAELAQPAGLVRLVLRGEGQEGGVADGGPAGGAAGAEEEGGEGGGQAPLGVGGQGVVGAPDAFHKAGEGVRGGAGEEGLQEDGLGQLARLASRRGRPPLPRDGGRHGGQTCSR